MGSWISRTSVKKWVHKLIRQCRPGLWWRMAERVFMFWLKAQLLRNTNNGSKRETVTWYLSKHATLDTYDKPPEKIRTGECMDRQHAGLLRPHLCPPSSRQSSSKEKDRQLSEQHSCGLTPAVSSIITAKLIQGEGSTASGAALMWPGPSCVLSDFCRVTSLGRLRGEKFPDKRDGGRKCQE